MAKFLKLAVWNANGLIQHRDELKMFLYTHNIDVMFMSETHFTEKSYIHIPQYTHYHTNHPAGTIRGGTAIMLKSSIQYHSLNPYSQTFLQATSVAVEDTTRLLSILAVYLPPKHTIHQ
jgi:exonuclease III